MTTTDKARVEALRQRWKGYDVDFSAGTASRETVVAAYIDWADAMDSVHQEVFEASEGRKILAAIGITGENK